MASASLILIRNKLNKLCACMVSFLKPGLAFPVGKYIGYGHF